MFLNFVGFISMLTFSIVKPTKLQTNPKKSQQINLLSRKINKSNVFQLFAHASKALSYNKSHTPRCEVGISLKVVPQGKPRPYIHTYIQAYIRAHVPAYIHIRTYTHTHTHTHTRTTDPRPRPTLAIFQACLNLHGSPWIAHTDINN